MKLQTVVAAFLFAWTFWGVWDAPAAAHGINGHIWVNDGAIDLVTDCSLAELLTQSESRNAAQIGGAFPDSGYGIDHPYGEAAHWEPYTQAHIEYVREVLPPPFREAEERRHAAFLLGSAAHGIEDEIFDSIYLHKAKEAEGTNQEILDPGTDFMLIADGYTDLQPDVYVPAKELVEVFADPRIAVEAEPNDFEDGLQLIRSVVIPLVTADESIADGYREQMPWAQTTYVDPRQPGSLAFEQRVVARYYEALWKRLHDGLRPQGLVIMQDPQPWQRLPTTDHTTVDSWVHLFFGVGVRNRTINSSTVRFLDEIGGEVPVAVHRVRWGGAEDWTRLVQIRPEIDLLNDHRYTIELSSEIERIDGIAQVETLRFSVQTTCATGTCPPPAPRPESASCETSGSVLPLPHGSSQDASNLFGCSVSRSRQGTWIGALIALLWWTNRRKDRCREVRDA